MLLINWLGVFASKLQWNLSRAARQARRQRKMMRRARRRQDSLSTQLEDLEARVMLSGVTAVADYVTISQLDQYVVVDVLSNDYSESGGLYIVNATFVQGIGDVIVEPVTEDRLWIMVESADYAPIIYYTIEDSYGTQSSSYVYVGLQIVTQQPPVLAAIPDQTIVNGTINGTVTLSATDPDNDPLTYSASAHSIEYYLDQKYGFVPGSDFHNYSQQHYERWLLAANSGYSGWYYILPNGRLNKSSDGSTVLPNTDLHVEQLSSNVYGNLALLHSATVSAPAVVSTSGSVLTINPNDTYIGKFAVTASVDDGRGGSHSQSFLVNVLGQIIDTTAPVVTSLLPANGSTVIGPNLNIDVTFSEVVTGVDVSDLVLTGAAAVSATKSTPTHLGNNQWRFSISNLVAGSLSVSLAQNPNSIEDAAGNDLARVDRNYTVTIADTTAPIVTSIAPVSGSSLVGASQNFDVTFSEVVTGADASDLILSGSAAVSAVKSTPVHLGNNVWRFTVSNLVSGSLNLTLAPNANSIEDLAGNDLAVRYWNYSISIPIVDNQIPVVTSIVPVSGSSLVNSSQNFDVTFSETVTGVDASDLVLSGSAAVSSVKSTPVHLGNNVWRFTVSNLVSGSLNAALAPNANSIEDLAGNDLAVHYWYYSVSIPIVDTQAPYITSISPSNGSTVSGPSLNIDVTFSEAVTGVGTSDLVLTGSAAGSAVKSTPVHLGNNVWRFAISNLGSGSLAVTLAPNANNIEDTAGNDLPSLTWNYTVNTQQPPSLLAIGDQTINNGTINITMTLSATDPNNDSLTYSALAQSIEYHLDQQYGFYQGNEYYNRSQQYNERWIAAANGTYSGMYYILPNGRLHKSGDGTSARPSSDVFVEQLSVNVYNNLASLHSPAYNNAPAIVSTSGSVLTINPTDSYAGRFVVTASVTDGRGGWDNKSFFVSVLGSSIDTQAPYVISTSPLSGASLSGSSHNIDVTFSEPVTGVDIGDLIVSGPAGTYVTKSAPINLGNNTWRFGISNVGSGTLYLTLGAWANSITDSVGNSLQSISWTYNANMDSQPPEVTSISPATGSSIIGSSQNFDIAFSEPVAGVDASDLGLSGPAAAFAVKSTPTHLGNNVWRFGVSNLAPGWLAVTLAPNANSITDGIGNSLAPRTWNYTVLSNQAPVLAAIPEKTIANGTLNGTVNLSATDANNDTLTYSATAQSIEYHLDQQYQFSGSSYFNFYGHSEKYVYGSTESKWYYVLPTGKLHVFAGAVNPQVDTLIGQLSVSAYTDTSLLHNATANNAPAAVAVTGNTLTINPTDSYIGSFVVTANVTDGHGGSDSKTFVVKVIGDYQAPTVTSITPSNDTTLSGSSQDFDVTFSEEVTGVEATDLVLKGSAAISASVAAATHLGNNVWRFSVTGLVSGTLIVALQSSSISDLAGNPSPGREWIYTVNVPNNTNDLHAQSRAYYGITLLGGGTNLVAGIEYSNITVATFEGSLTGHDPVIDWGDGTSSSGNINGTSIVGSHKYANPGSYKVIGVHSHFASREFVVFYWFF